MLARYISIFLIRKMDANCDRLKHDGDLATYKCEADVSRSVTGAHSNPLGYKMLRVRAVSCGTYALVPSCTVP